MGFFAAESFGRAPLPMVAQCGACGLERTAEVRKVPVRGEGRAGILLVSESPVPHESSQATFFLRQSLRAAEEGLDMDRDCWLTYANICSSANTPTDKQVANCRPNLTILIDRLRPTCIVPLGATAIRSVLLPLWEEGEYTVEKWSGWEIPCQELNAWVCPTYHPAAVCTDGDVVMRILFERHLSAAAVRAASGPPWEDRRPDLSKAVEVVMEEDRAVRAITAYIGSENYVAVDLETNMLKPDSALAEIATCALSDGRRTVAYPWTRSTREATRRLITSGGRFVASNQKFEERWFIKEFGHGVDSWYRDTMLRAHWEDCRRGVTGLKFQAFAKVGQPKYDRRVEAYFESPAPNTPNRIRQVPIRDLLVYNGMDALLEWMLV